MADSFALHSKKTADLFADGLNKNGGGLYKGMLYKAVADNEDVASILSGAMGSFTIAATGVRVGDWCLGVHPGLAAGAVAGLIYGAQVSADDTITVTIFNISGGAIDLAAQDFSVLVMPDAPIGVV